jgi:hypothetical protein
VLTAEKGCCFSTRWGNGPHCERNFLTAKVFLFGGHIVGRSLRPLRSPDPTQPDFFAWGFLKERVYSNNQRRLEKLKYGVRIDEETLGKFARNKKMGKYLSSRRWWTFSESAVKLFFKFFLTNTIADVYSLQYSDIPKRVVQATSRGSLLHQCDPRVLLHL